MNFTAFLIIAIIIKYGNLNISLLYNFKKRMLNKKILSQILYLLFIFNILIIHQIF